jgi:hypothetical protein
MSVSQPEIVQVKFVAAACGNGDPGRHEFSGYLQCGFFVKYDSDIGIDHVFINNLSLFVSHDNSQAFTPANVESIFAE